MDISTVRLVQTFDTRETLGVRLEKQGDMSESKIQKLVLTVLSTQAEAEPHEQRHISQIKLCDRFMAHLIHLCCNY